MAKVEVNEVPSFVGDVRTEVAADYAVPGRVVFFVEFFFDVGSDVLLDIESLHGLIRAVYCVLLHFFGHVRVLDYCFAFSHIYWGLKFERDNQNRAYLIQRVGLC